ncbi:MAG: transaldolase [Halomonadaceae bacterium]|nr:MAG: transaldolase [Halomonadaceae bacterium]
MTSKLDQLRQMTTVVADSGNLDDIRQWQPQDATTNPSLLLKATESAAYQPMIDDAIKLAQHSSKDETNQLANATDYLAVLAGEQILSLVPGLVSTEVDARLSFDTEATLARARKLIRLYQSRGVDTSRVLIKIAATWEGIRAAEILEQEGIACNLTLLFSFPQAVACAEAGVTLISPFVGRILDWHLANSGRDHFPPGEDPGVLSVSRIYDYYKTHHYKTIVMGASFRNQGEIEMLAGCDRLTISPALLEQLAQDSGELARQLDPSSQKGEPLRKPMNENQFRWELNEDAMTTEKLADGIRRFAADQVTLEQRVRKVATAA